MLDKIVSKLKKIFTGAADNLPENATAAEIDNFLDDVIAATEKIEKAEGNTGMEAKLEEMANTISDLENKISGQNTVIKELNDNFSQQLQDIKADYETQIKNLKTDLDSFKESVKSDLKDIKTGKSKDIQLQEKDGDEEEKKVVSSNFMSKYLG